MAARGRGENPLAHCIDLRAMLKCALAGSRAPASLQVREAFPKRYAWGKTLRTGFRHTVSGIPCCRMAGAWEPAQGTHQRPTQANCRNASRIWRFCRLVLNTGESAFSTLEVAVIGEFSFCPLPQLFALLGVPVAVDTLYHRAPDE